MSHDERVGVSHTRVTNQNGVTHFGYKKCGRTAQIDVSANVHVKVSHVRWFDVTVENHAKCTDMTEMGQI
jgi:hypothetical protein